MDGDEQCEEEEERLKKNSYLFARLHALRQAFSVAWHLRVAWDTQSAGIASE